MPGGQAVPLVPFAPPGTGVVGGSGTTAVQFGKVPLDAPPGAQRVQSALRSKASGHTPHWRPVQGNVQKQLQPALTLPVTDLAWPLQSDALVHVL